MEDQKQLVNDSDLLDDNIDDLQNISRPSEKDLISQIGPLLARSKEDLYSNNPILEGCLTLRECNLLYRNSQGCKDKKDEIPEFDRCQTRGSISPLRRFNNSIGHFVKDTALDTLTDYFTICFEPKLYSNLDLFKEGLKDSLHPSVSRRYLWSLLNCGLCFKTESGLWQYNSDKLDQNLCSIFDVLSVSFVEPLSVHTQHAWYESQDTRDIIYKVKVFKQPQETTAVTGILGTLQNNQAIDLAQELDSEQPNIELRYKDIEVPGFLCSGHTAHSMEAGRVRRVCHNVSVRVLNDKMLNRLYVILQAANRHNSDRKQWTLFCMGKIVYCSTKCLIFIRDKLISLSFKDFNTCTLHINNRMHTAILSISSGVLLRRDSNNIVISNVSLYSSRWPDDKYTATLPDESTEEGFKFYFSTFFQLTPYIAFDRPPRTLISSVQSIQAVTTPFGAGTASIAPVHTSIPLVSTPLIEKLIDGTINKSECNLADLVPGQDLIICLANFNDTNEDSIMISEASVGRGLYSYLGYSSHVVKDSEKIPAEGEYANMDEHRWWKCYSRNEQSRGLKSKGRNFIAGGDGRGKVVSTSITQSNQISVKVLRYSTTVTGDKLATGHGQKGVVKLIADEDMPWAFDDRGECIRFDIIMSLSSVSNRITAGQYYEMVTGIRAAKEGRRVVVSAPEYESQHSEVNLYCGKSGQLITRFADNREVPVNASWGISRVWQMTQLTWDKQHYTHNTASSTSISAAVGRTAGGGIRFGEMDSHAIDASGLTKANAEIKSRMDLIDVDYCTQCETIIQHCSCNSSVKYIKISIPHSMMVYVHATRLTTGYIVKLKV